MDSLGIGIGTEFLDWTVSEPESESKKLEPETSELLLVLLGNRNQVRCQPNIAINNNSQELGEILVLAILSFKIQEENKIQFHHSHSSSLRNGSTMALAETAKAPLLSISVLLWQKGPFTWVPKLPYTYNSAVR